jgi:hypothetical protein
MCRAITIVSCPEVCVLNIISFFNQLFYGAQKLMLLRPLSPESIFLDTAKIDYENLVVYCKNEPDYLKM